MKMTLSILIFGICLCGSTLLFAVIGNKKTMSVTKPADTVYYLADTLHVPKKDRLFVIEDSYMAKSFLVYCSCLNTEEGFIYLTGAYRRKILIGPEKLKSLKFISLADLITITKTHNTLDFEKKYVIYIVLPGDKGMFEMYPAINRSNNITQRTHENWK